MQVRLAHLCILVKAYPQPSQKYEETVCCAGISDTGEFLRLYPIPYRRLLPEQRFDRFDVIEAKIFKAEDDWRRESYKVDPDSIRIVQVGSRLSAEEKVALWSRFVVDSLVALRQENIETQRSLGIVKPDAGSVKFWAKPADRNDSESNEIFSSLLNQASLFNAEPLPKLTLEFTFGFTFTSAGHRHEMKIHDWEVQAAYHHYKRRYRNEALSRLEHVYGTQLPTQNLHFVLGTMKAHPRQFIIIGLLRSSVSPEAATRQDTLF